MATTIIYTVTKILFTQGGRTPLMRASFDGYVEIVKILVEAKAQINAQDRV